MRMSRFVGNSRGKMRGASLPNITPQFHLVKVLATVVN
jgi:hypothetical protein